MNMNDEELEESMVTETQSRTSRVTPEVKITAERNQEVEAEERESTRDEEDEIEDEEIEVIEVYISQKAK